MKRGRVEGDEAAMPSSAASSSAHGPSESFTALARTMASTNRKLALKGVERAGEGDRMPQKRYFRQRAHINPLNFTQVYTYPIAPERMAWGAHFPAHSAAAVAAAAAAAAPSTSSSASSPPASAEFLAPRTYVEVADIGCGFGGLVVGLAPVFPSSLMVGMEIRGKVTEYVRLRILALRNGATPLEAPAEGADVDEALAAAAAKVAAEEAAAEAAAEAEAEAEAAASASAAAAAAKGYDNISVIKTNAMKYLPNFFGKGQLKKIFFCFADPQFKPSHHRRRIVTTQLLAEYAFVLAPGEGRLYTITDVRDLHNWQSSHADAHPYFRRLTDEELAADPAVAVMRVATEEGKKVERNKGDKHVAVFARLTDAEADAKAAAFDFWTEPPVDYLYSPAPAQAEFVERAALSKGFVAESEWQRLIVDRVRAEQAAAKAGGAVGSSEGSK
jgi:tRNA (guanine-N7-)-methyltransferase